jgi:hypothetical protein
MIKRKTHLRKEAPAKTPLAKLKKDLWKVLSELVRREGQYCITCEKPLNWKESNAGHFIHGKKYPYAYFDRRNVNAQCRRCNLYLDGARDTYAVKLVEMYGDGILRELFELKREMKPPREFFEDRLHEYTQTLDRLRRLDAGRQ